MFLSFFRLLQKNFLASFEESDGHLINYAIAVFLGFLAFYAINSWIFSGAEYENFLLRVGSALLATPLALKDRWPERFKPFLIFYWYVVLVYTLPFFFTFMLLHNASSSLWHVNGLIGLVVLALFVDWLSYLVLLVVGVGLGVLAYVMTEQNIKDGTFISVGATALNYIVPILYIMFFSTKRRHIQHIKQQSLKMQAGAIAHEMRTPLTAIESVASGLEHHLPTLVATQKRVQDQDPTTSPRVGRLALKALLDAPSDLQNITRSAANVISMLLMNLREDVPPTPPTVCSIAECVEGALRDYALNAQDRALITVHADADFKFLGSPLMIKHVFFNLLKNALHHVKELQKGGITIQTGINDGGQGTVVFEDTSKGIPADHLPHIFDQFFTRTAFGSGVGLAFCKMVMTKLGGDIACTSVYGEYTRFTLTFPLVHGETSPVSMG